MKDECGIIRDLLPCYVEQLESNQTKKFVEKHINECDECKEILKNMQSDKINEKEKNEKEDQVEIKNIKKYRRKNINVKIIIIVLILIVISLGSIFAKYAKNSNIIFEAYNHIQEVKETNNFKIIVEEHRKEEGMKQEEINTYEYLYKDGKYKKNIYSNSVDNGQTYFGSIDSKEYIFVNDNKKLMKKSTLDENIRKEDFFELFTEINFNAKNKKGLFVDLISMIRFDVMIKDYNGKECYVIRHEGKSSYRETWIEKETMLQVREIYKETSGNYNEKIIFVEINSVTDSDVVFQNNGEYTLE